MTPKQIAQKASKVIKMHAEDAILNKVYFNPMFALELSRMVGELAESGMSISYTETETKGGAAVSAKIVAETDELDLGTIFLDGVDIKIKVPLSTVNDLVDFIGGNATEV